MKYWSFKSCCHQGASNQFHFKEERKEKTSLQIAVEKRFFDIFDLFLSRKEININEKQIIQSKEYTKSTKDNIFTLNKQETLNEKTAIHIAIEKNDNEIVEMLLKYPEIDLNIKSINNGKLSKMIRSELINSNLIQSKYQIKDQYYTRKFSQNCIKFNIYNKNYSNSSNEEELTNEKVKLEIIKNLIKQEQMINFEDHFLFDERELNQARTSLFIANKNKNQFIIQLLLTNKNIDVNQSSNIETNIITKTHNQNSQKQKFSKQQKLAKNEEKTVLHAAIDDDNIEIVQYLLSHTKIDVNKNSFITIKEEIERFPISIEFSDSKQKENCIDKRNCISPLCLAVINDNIEIIKLLLLNEKLNLNRKSSIQFKKEKILFDSLEKAKEFDFNMELQQKKDDAEIIHNLSF